jgi:hypothetical protein
LNRFAIAALTIAIAAGVASSARAASTGKGAVTIKVANAGFEEPGGADKIPGWILSQHVGPKSFVMDLDQTAPFAGHASFRMQRTRQQIYGAIAQQIPVAGYAGKTLEFSAKVKTAAVGAEGWVLTIDVPGERVSSAPATGTSAWHTVTIRARLPDAARTATIGAMLLDDGTAWLDDVRVRVVDK